MCNTIAKHTLLLLYRLHSILLLTFEAITLHMIKERRQKLFWIENEHIWAYGWKKEAENYAQTNFVVTVNSYVYNVENYALEFLTVFKLSLRFFVFKFILPDHHHINVAKSIEAFINWGSWKLLAWVDIPISVFLWRYPMYCIMWKVSQNEIIFNRLLITYFVALIANLLMLSIWLCIKRH